MNIFSSETGSERASPNVSRNASFASNQSSYHSAAEVAASSSSSVSRGSSCRVNEQQRSDQQTDKDKEDKPRTVTTLMGGRGYIQWRSAHVEKNKTSHLAQINNSDAYLVIWDYRLQ